MRIPRSKVLALVLIALIVGATLGPFVYASCSDPTGPAQKEKPVYEVNLRVRSVDITPDSLPLEVNDTGNVSCRVYNKPNKTGTLLANACTFVLRDTAVAQVVSASGQTGKVKAKKVGLTYLVTYATSNPGIRDSARVRVYSTVTVLTTKSVYLKPDPPQQWPTVDDWHAKGIYYMDSTRMLYGVDTMPLGFTCPEAGGGKCPGRRLCPITEFSDGKVGIGGPWTHYAVCVQELEKYPVEQRTVTPAHQAILDTLCTGWSAIDTMIGKYWIGRVTQSVCGDTLQLGGYVIAGWYLP